MRGGEADVIKAGTVLGLLLAVSGGTGTADAAAVLKPRACNTDGAAVQLHVTARAVHLRSGKGTSHTSRALLSRNTDFYAECWGTFSDTWWACGEVIKGPHNGKPSWVSGATWQPATGTDGPSRRCPRSDTERCHGVWVTSTRARCRRTGWRHRPAASRATSAITSTTASGCTSVTSKDVA